MEWIFKANQTNDKNTASSLVGLDNLKEEIKKDDPSEEKRLTLLLNMALDYFQNRTGFYIQEGDFTLTLGASDIPPSLYNPRQSRTRNTLNYYNDRSFEDQALIFRAPISAKIPTSKPSLFSFVQRGGFTSDVKTITLTKTELDSLPDDFLTMVSQRPFSFYLKKDEEVLREKSFEYFSTFSLKLGLTSIVSSSSEPFIEEEIKYALVKIAAIYYEYPDLPKKVEEDDYLRNLFFRYNSNKGL